MTIYLLILVIGLLSGCLSGVVGSGVGLIMLPVLVYAFGPQQAVPMMAITAIMGNLGKVLSWWRAINWRVFFIYAGPGIPASMVGARTFLVLPPTYASFILGFSLILMVPGRRWLHAHDIQIGAWGLAMSGIFIGLLSGLAQSAGSLSISAFTAFGMSKGPMLSTESLASLTLSGSKIVVFRELGALPSHTVVLGLMVGSTVLAGTFFGKAVMQRITTETFHLLLDTMTLCSGLSLIWAAVSAPAI
jgi:uncharacterized membrane protein YfcA